MLSLPSGAAIGAASQEGILSLTEETVSDESCDSDNLGLSAATKVADERVHGFPGRP